MESVEGFLGGGKPCSKGTNIGQRRPGWEQRSERLQVDEDLSQKPLSAHRRRLALTWWAMEEQHFRKIKLAVAQECNLTNTLRVPIICQPLAGGLRLQREGDPGPGLWGENEIIL